MVSYLINCITLIYGEKYFKVEIFLEIDLANFARILQISFSNLSSKLTSEIGGQCVVFWLNLHLAYQKLREALNKKLDVINFGHSLPPDPPNHIS